MERKNNQLTFLDNVTHDLGGKRTAAFFAKCDQYIPWPALTEPRKDMYDNTTSKGGASNWPIVMMIKCMMLQKWFNLSDPMLEEMLLDRSPFAGLWVSPWMTRRRTRPPLLSAEGVFASTDTVQPCLTQPLKSLNTA